MSHQNHPSKHIQNLFPTTPKFLPCVFFFFSLTLFEKRTRREIPPRKKVSKNCCCFLGRRRRQKTEDSNIIIERKKRSEKNIYLPQILEPFTRLLKTPRPRAHTPWSRLLQRPRLPKCTNANASPTRDRARSFDHHPCTLKLPNRTPMTIFLSLSPWNRIPHFEMSK